MKKKKKKSKIFTGVIYVATCLITGKQYVGQTVRKRPMSRWDVHFEAARNGSKNIFARAIRKYGESAFTFKIVFHARED